MEIKDDFYQYFERFGVALEADDSLYCVSAMNELGGGGILERKNTSFSQVFRSSSYKTTTSSSFAPTPFIPPTLYPSSASFARSDTFLGKGGWMITKSLWNELKKDNNIDYSHSKDNYIKWPILGMWRNWMDSEEQRKGFFCSPCFPFLPFLSLPTHPLLQTIGRNCIYPEVSRVRNIQSDVGGEWKKGLTGGWEGWQALDLIYLMEGEWKRRLKEEAKKATQVFTLGEAMSYPSSSVKLSYSGREEMKEIEEGLLGGVSGAISKYSYDGVMYLRVGDGRGEVATKIIWLVPRGRGYVFKQPSWMAPLSFPSSSNIPYYPDETVMIITCYNRPDYLHKTLQNVLKYLPSDVKLLVSQDGNDEVKAFLQVPSLK